jgi:hypothetical protein
VQKLHTTALEFLDLLDVDVGPASAAIQHSGDQLALPAHRWVSCAASDVAMLQADFCSPLASEQSGV